MPQQKDLRLNIRVTPEQRALVETAAKLKRTTISAFILNQACEAAEKILADQRHFELGPKEWQAFCEALDRPARNIPELERLMARPSVFPEESAEFSNAGGGSMMVREARGSSGSGNKRTKAQKTKAKKRSI